MFARRTTLVTLALAATAAAQKECVVPHGDGGDDSPAILKTFQDCNENAVIRFEQANYTAYTPMTWDGLSASSRLSSLFGEG